MAWMQEGSENGNKWRDPGLVGAELTGIVDGLVGVDSGKKRGVGESSQVRA